MEDLIERKEKANDEMTKGNYDEAIKLFDEIINLKVTNEDEAIICCLCLLNRSICKIQKEDLDGALADAEMVKKTMQIIRPDVSIDTLTSEDKFTAILALAEFRIGQIYESKEEALLAMQHYTYSIKLSPKAGGQQALLRVYGELNLPAIDPEDEDLLIFSDLIRSLPFENKVLMALSNIMNYFDKDKIEDDILDKFADEGIYLIIYACMQLYIDEPVIVSTTIVILRKLAETGILDVFNGLPVIKNALEHNKENSDVMGAAISFISLSVTPISKQEHEPGEEIIGSGIQSNDNEDFTPDIAHALQLDLTPDEAESAFIYLFNTVHRQDVIKLKEYNIIDSIFKYKCNASILLLSKITTDPTMCKEAIEKGANVIAMNILKNVNDDILLPSGMLILSYIFLYDEETKKKMASECFDLLVPVLTKNAKNAQISSNAINLMSQILEYNVEKAKEKRVVRISSLIFAINKNDPNIVRSIINFLFICVQNDLVNEITDIPTYFQTIIEVIPKYASNKEIMEKAIFLGMVTGHPKGPALLSFGLEKFPDSALIAKIGNELQNKK